MGDTTTTTTMTDRQATDEAMLLLIRKLRRLHPDAAADVWKALPEGAQRAVMQAETRADVLRTQAGDARNLVWPAVPDLDDDGDGR